MPYDEFGNWVPGINQAPWTPGNSILGGGGGGGGDGDKQILSYADNPNTEGVVPDDQNSEAVAYAINNDGPTAYWHPVDHNWIGFAP